MTAHGGVTHVVDERDVAKRINLEAALGQQRVAIGEGNAGHDVNLRARGAHRVQEQQNIAQVAAPAREQDVLLFVLLVLKNRHDARVAPVPLLGRVGVVVFGDNHQLAPLCHHVVVARVQRDLAVLRVANADRDRLGQHELHVLPLGTHQLRPVLGVKFVTLKAEDGPVHLRQAGLPDSHEHQTPNDIVRNDGLDVAASDEVDQRLVVLVPHLRHDVSGERHVVQVEDHLEDLRVSLVREHRGVREDHDGPRGGDGHLIQVSNHQTRALSEHDGGPLQVSLLDEQVQLLLHLLLAILAQHHDDAAALGLVRVDDLLHEQQRLLGPSQHDGVTALHHHGLALAQSLHLGLHRLDHETEHRGEVEDAHDDQRVGDDPRHDLDRRAGTGRQHAGAQPATETGVEGTVSRRLGRGLNKG